MFFMLRYNNIFAINRMLVFLLLVMPAHLSLQAQSDSKAAALFEAGKYDEAKEMYENMLRRSPKNLLYTYRYARCLQETGDHEAALGYFAKTKKKYVLSYFFTAESCMALWRSDEAIEAYQAYLDNATNSDRAEHIAAQIQTAEMRKRYIRRVRELEVFDSVVLPKNAFLQAYRLSSEAGTLSQDTGGCVTYSNQRGDRCIYAVPFDGGTRLATRYRLLDRWSQPDTLSETVNSAEHQNYPFCESDGVTIYFASDAPDGFGGLDIYMSRYNSATDTYAKPENVGFPFNSEGNDYMLATDEMRHTGYFATDRFCPPDSVCVYSFRLTAEPQYISGMEPDTLALFAQMKLFRRAQNDPIEDMQAPQYAEEPQSVGQALHAIRFVLNDSTVYLAEEDFVSSEAQKLYGEYCRQTEQCHAAGLRLDELREEYRNADTARRQKLAPEITKLEKEYKHLLTLQKQTLQQVRLLETEAAGKG